MGGEPDSLLFIGQTGICLAPIGVVGCVCHQTPVDRRLRGSNIVRAEHRKWADRNCRAPICSQIVIGVILNPSATLQGKLRKLSYVILSEVKNLLAVTF